LVQYLGKREKAASQGDGLKFASMAAAVWQSKNNRCEISNPYPGGTPICLRLGEVRHGCPHGVWHRANEI